MAVSISYMGTKRQLVSAVAEVIGHAQPGTLFDVFSGMCSVGQEVGASRQIWTNDIQRFAAEVGAALFTSKEDSVDPSVAAAILSGDFVEHCGRLSKRFRKSLHAERRALRCHEYPEFVLRQGVLSGCLADEMPKRIVRTHNLFVTTYANSYFGVGQAIEIDALRFAVDRAALNRRFSLDQKRWLLIALGKTILKLSNSTGHFAQFLKPNQRSYRTYLRQRHRQVWDEWLLELSQMSSVGSRCWRQQNRAFNADSLPLLRTLARARGQGPSVVYADPPYTDDQYSRYYHILETLLLYDYPVVTGAGLYRANRYTTPFSHKSSAPAALEMLICLTAKIGADLILSYPTNGLVHEAGVDPKKLLIKHFRHVEIGFSLKHTHSTFGASKGEAQAAVTERIYIARNGTTTGYAHRLAC